jgi:hypothetical protein
MSAFSDYYEDAIAAWVRGTTFPAATGSLYCALFTAAPSDSGGGTEVSGNAYVRQTLSKATGTWTLGSAGTGQISNTAAITFPAATPAGWGTITHFGLFDASTAGNLIVHGALTASKAIGIGDVFQFAIGQLIITFA